MTVSADDLEFTTEELKKIGETGSLLRTKSYYVIFDKSKDANQFLDSDDDETGLFTDNYQALHEDLADAQKQKQGRLDLIQEEIDGYDENDDDDRESIADSKKELESVRENWIVSKLTVTINVHPVTQATGSDVLQAAYGSVKD